MITVVYLWTNFTVWSGRVEAIVTARAPVRGRARAPADGVHTSVPLQNPVIGVPQGARSIRVSLTVTYCITTFMQTVIEIVIATAAK